MAAHSRSDASGGAKDPRRSESVGQPIRENRPENHTPAKAQTQRSPLVANGRVHSAHSPWSGVVFGPNRATSVTPGKRSGLNYGSEGWGFESLRARRSGRERSSHWSDLIGTLRPSLGIPTVSQVHDPDPAFDEGGQALHFGDVRREDRHRLR